MPSLLFSLNVEELVTPTPTSNLESRVDFSHDGATMFEAVPVFSGRSTRRMVFAVALTAGLFLSICIPSRAQELGAVLRSDMGLKSGTQPAPGYYFSFVYYDAEYTSVRGPNGNALPGQVSTSLTLPFPVIAATTKWKLLGANYGLRAAIIFSNQALTSTLVPISKSNTIGFGDIYIQPQCCPKKVRAVHGNCLIERK